MDRVSDFIETIRIDWGAEIGATLVVIVVTVVVLALVRSALRRWTSRVEARYALSDDHEQREQAKRLRTITDVVRMVFSLIVWAVAVLTVMAIWGVPMTPLVTIGATVGVAIGFGAQDFVRDVIGGFFVLVEEQYSVGDVVRIADVSGSVEAITLRSTVLRDLDGNRHFVPNGQIQVASNMTSGFSRVVVDIPVSYDTDLDRAMDVIADEASIMSGSAEWSGSFLEPPSMLGVDRLDASAVNIRVVLTTVSDERWLVKRGFLKLMKQRLDREGIEIPYQYVNLVARENPSSDVGTQDEDRVLDG
ncbi:MAG TPA: mechanosensitive ion channel family protein [Acidimicrobiia bacterium]|nr:mechanosensitive ion channel family protein [Acidimicrobiia bacterium]